jgi:hypothetical protein
MGFVKSEVARLRIFCCDNERGGMSMLGIWADQGGEARGGVGLGIKKGKIRA